LLPPDEYGHDVLVSAGLASATLCSFNGDAEDNQLKTPRTLLIGLDGATFDLIEPLAKTGYLPVLARLMDEGVHFPLQAWPNMNSAAAWSSMVTGYNSGHHGIYHFGDASPQRGRIWRPTTAADRRKDPFWRLLSAAGQRVGVINVRISYPADPINGFMLAGMDAPGVHGPRFAHPPGLQDELRLQGIDYLIDVPNLAALSKMDPHRALQAAQRMVDGRSRTILHLMATRPWNVLMAVFVATDRMQHFFWPDRHAPVKDHAWTPIRSIYRRIDSFLGKALECIEENTTVLVVSDHGFGPAQFVGDCLNPLFAHLGLLRYRQGRRRLKSWLLKYPLLYGRQVIPHRLQGLLARTLPGIHRLALHESVFSGIDWSHTRVFASEYGQGVFVNLEGRETEGTVSLDDYHHVCERVRSILLDLTDPASGRRVIQEVHRREHIYRGPFLEEAPDLVIEWDDEVAQDSLCHIAEGERVIIQAPKRIGPGKRWTGSHRSQGIFIACGPHINQGATVRNANLCDIAPTILYLQGHPVPGDMDGRVLTEIFAEEQLRHHPVQGGEPATVKAQAAATVLDAEEARNVEDRLRGLGYLE
jgi:predicted AlkP superfamily phosphohydrolase/phosphomutase